MWGRISFFVGAALLMSCCTAEDDTNTGPTCDEAALGEGGSTTNLCHALEACAGQTWSSSEWNECLFDADSEPPHAVDVCAVDLMGSDYDCEAIDECVTACDGDMAGWTP